MKFVTMLLASAIVTGSVADPLTAGTTLDSTISENNWIQGALQQISYERMMADITELSGPRFRGRQTGTDEDRESATARKHAGQA